MKARYFILLLGSLVLMSACTEAKKQDEEPESHEEHIATDHGGHAGSHANDANEHMHQRPVEELIERFESPERDAYQNPDKVLDYLGDISNKTIMDIGAGSGYFSVRLADRGARVIAADVSEEFQSSLKKRIEENNLQNIELRKIPYDGPGLSEKEVDMVFIVNTYHHIEDRPAYFAKVKRGIKENGELIVIDFFKKELPVGPGPDHKVAMSIAVDELEQAGFAIADVNVDLLPYQYVIRAR